MTRSSILMQTLTSLLVPLLLVLGVVQGLASDRYLAFEYGKIGFPADPYGFDRKQRLELGASILHWLRAGQPVEMLAAQQLGGQPLYNQRELKHMQDVQVVFQGARLIWRFALGLFILIGLFLIYRKGGLQDLAQGLKVGGLLAAGLVAGIGLLAVLAWQIWFVAFHQVFFAAGTWTFNTSDTLIRLFPERFWYDAAMTLSGLSLVGGLGVALLGWSIQKRKPSIPRAITVQRLNPTQD